MMTIRDDRDNMPLDLHIYTYINSYIYNYLSVELLEGACVDAQKP